MRIKIFHVITSFGYGGAERLLVNVANEQSYNHNVTIIIFKKNYNLLCELNENINVVKLNFNLLIFYNLRQFLKKNQPDIVHTHLGHADLITMISSIGLSGKYFSTMHNIYFKKNRVDNFYFLTYRLFSRTFAKKFHFIAISTSVYNHLLYTLKIDKHKIHLLYNAIKLNKDKNCHNINVNNKFNLLFVGRLTKQKNVELLINAIPILKTHIPNIILNIVGEGVLKEKLAEIVSLLNINDRVRFFNFVDDPSPFFQKSDLFVLPSIFEGFGIVVLEAFNNCLPVLASDIEGPKELISDSINGFLFKSNDLDDLVYKIMYIYNNQYLLDNIKLNALNFVKNFSIEVHVKNLNDIYEIGN